MILYKIKIYKNQFLWFIRPFSNNLRKKLGIFRSNVLDLFMPNPLVFYGLCLFGIDLKVQRHHGLNLTEPKEMLPEQRLRKRTQMCM